MIIDLTNETTLLFFAIYALAKIAIKHRCINK